MGGRRRVWGRNRNLLASSHLPCYHKNIALSLIEGKYFCGMLFNSYIFILIFLPVCISGYFFLNHLKLRKTAQAFLLGMSLWFYGYFNVRYLLIILSSILFNYAASVLFGRLKKGALRKAAFWVSICFNVGLLFYFKYYDFFLENINGLFRTDFPLKRVLLPLGISFFTFQQLSYIIDCYRGEAAGYGFLEYASFVSFFPQLVAGPIVTHEELVPQFADETKKKFDWENFSKGLYLFALGMAKKVLIADMFGNAVNIGYGNIGLLNSTDAVVTMLAYTVQIYFDFSGYCDMAVGLGRMFNIELPVNFDSPYKALTITEFWERWHKTLTRFFRKYIYFPLGGSRKGKARTYVNVMIVFLVSGLWHGANWTFVLWGFCHGVFSVVTRCCKRIFDRLPAAFNWLVTFLFINVTWVVFRADSLEDAALLLSRIFRFDFGPVRGDLALCFGQPEWRWLFGLGPLDLFTEKHPCFFLTAFFGIAFAMILFLKNAYEKTQKLKPTPFYAVVTAVLLAWCVCSFSGVTTFLYFNF